MYKSSVKLFDKLNPHYSHTYQHPTDRRAGIEIEVESTVLNTISLRSKLREHSPGVQVRDLDWEVVTDGSLRSGMEIRTRVGGLPFKDCIKSLSHIAWCLPLMRETFRDGIHYNGDVGDFTRGQLVLFILFTSLLSDSLFASSSASRIDSNFCVPWRNMSALLLHIVEELDKEDWVTDMLLRFPKYSEVNLASVHEKGCVEFRHLKTPYVGQDDPYDEAVPAIANYSAVCNELLGAAAHPAYIPLTYTQALESFYDCISPEVDIEAYNKRHPALRAMVKSYGLGSKGMLFTAALLTRVESMDCKQMDSFSVVKSIFRDVSSKRAMDEVSRGPFSVALDWGNDGEAEYDEE